MVATYNEYQKEKLAFFEKHNYDYIVETSSMDEYGTYYKTYRFNDNAVWSERTSPQYVQVNVEVYKVQATAEVKMLCTEYWSTETKSKFYYENY